MPVHPDAFDVIPYEVCRATSFCISVIVATPFLSGNYCTGYQRQLEKAGLWFVWECL